MSKENRLYSCRYVNPKCDRIYEIQVFGVYSDQDTPIRAFGASSNIEVVNLPPTTMSVTSIDDGQYEIPFGMPEPMFATISIDISELDIENNINHKNFVELVMMPDKCSLKPCLAVKETSTKSPADYSGVTFLGKINKGIAEGLGLHQKQIALKVEHIISYVLRNIKVPNYLALPNDTTSIVDIFTYVTEAEEYQNKIRQHDSPFAFYLHSFQHNYQPSRYALLDATESMETQNKKVNYYRQAISTNSPPNTWGKGYNQGIEADAPDYPDGKLTNVIERYVHELKYSNLYYVNLSDMFNCIGDIIKNEYKKHCRNYVDVRNFRLSNIFNQIKYYKQKYDASGEKGALLATEDLYIKKGVQLFNKESGFSFQNLVKRCRWNNLFDVLETLALANLCKVNIYTDNIGFTDGKSFDTTFHFPNGLMTMDINSMQPAEISDIKINVNPLDNLDVVYLEHTGDDITNQQDAIAGVNNTDKCTSIQLVWHNQIPNNAKGWKWHDNFRDVINTLAQDRYANWAKWGARRSDARNWNFVTLNKAGGNFVYLLWYIEEAGVPAGMMARRQFPYLVHFDTQAVIKGYIANNKAGETAAKNVSKAQVTGCLHNQVIDKIREDWYNDRTTPHYELTLKIPIVLWEQFSNGTNKRQEPTAYLRAADYKINTKTAWGHDLSKSDKWFVIGCTRNIKDGTCELKLINNR